jgi:hypothetical protein
MIWESHYWKKDLARLADCLRKRARQRQWSERSLAKMEKEVFIGFYSLRKLLEGKKLSGKVVNRGLYPRTPSVTQEANALHSLTGTQGLLTPSPLTNPRKSTCPSCSFAIK